VAHDKTYIFNSLSSSLQRIRSTRLPNPAVTRARALFAVFGGGGHSLRRIVFSARPFVRGTTAGRHLRDDKSDKPAGRGDDRFRYPKLEQDVRVHRRLMNHVFHTQHRSVQKKTTCVVVRRPTNKKDYFADVVWPTHTSVSCRPSYLIRRKFIDNTGVAAVFKLFQPRGGSFVTFL